MIGNGFAWNEKLETYEWPGNLRELRNVLEYAVLAGDGPEITLADLPPWFGVDERASGHAGALAGAGFGVAEVQLPLDYHDALSSFEKMFLEQALRRFRGRVNYTARRIGMNKTTLIRRMRSYGLGSELETTAHVDKTKIS